MRLARHESSPYLASPCGAYIGYTPDRGEKVAWILYHELTSRRVPAYLDLNDLKAGPRRKQILCAIEDHPYFVLVLNHPECLDVLSERHSPLREHVTYKLRSEGYIVPFVREDLDLSCVPRRLARLRDLARVEYSVEYFAAAVKRLVRLFR